MCTDFVEDFLAANIPYTPQLSYKGIISRESKNRAGKNEIKFPFYLMFSTFYNEIFCNCLSCVLLSLEIFLLRIFPTPHDPNLYVSPHAIIMEQLINVSYLINKYDIEMFNKCIIFIKIKIYFSKI
jgi:hypothetical protein